MLKFKLITGCAISALTLAFNASALAQPAPAAPADAAEGDNSLETVVVTGVATAGGRIKLDTSYSETSLSQEQVKVANPTTFADLLKSSPGVYVESSGGPTGVNLEVAGFPGSGAPSHSSFELNGVPIFPTSFQTNLEPTAMFRVDDAMERMEMVQGGPTVLYGVGAPALTVNYILKRGTDTLKGDAGITYGSEGAVRLDGFVGLPIDEKNKIYGSIGGFYSSNDNGVRDPQFSALGGGQVTGTLSKDWDNGSLLLFGRYLNYSAQFATDTPIYNPAVGVFKQYPGFSPLTGSLESKADQYLQLQVSPCTGTGCTPGSIPINLATGRGPNMYTFGGEFNWDFGGGLQLLDDFGYTGGQVNMVALYSTSSTTAGANPETLSAYIANRITANKLPTGTAAFAYYTDTGDAVPLTQNVLTEELRYLHQTFRSTSNELHLSYDFFPGNTITVGNYVAVYGVNELQYAGDNLLLQAQNNPSPIAITLTSGTSTYQLTDSQGFSLAPQKAVRLIASGFKNAFFVSDTWKFDDFLVDAGMRVDHESFVDHYGKTTKGKLSSNALQLYNRSAQYLSGGYTDVPYHATGVSWTVGANYRLDDNMSVYARVNNGIHLAAFSELSTGTTSIPMQKNKNFEVGYKYSSPWVYLDVDAFHREFSGIPQSGLYVINGVSQTETLNYGSHAWGMGWQALVRPFAESGDWLENFSLATNGAYAVQHYGNTGCVTYQDISNNVQTVCNASLVANGLALARQPSFQIRATPSYKLPTDWGYVKAWLTFEYVGQHYGDMYQAQDLGSYYDFSAGLSGTIDENWEWTIRGTNIFNQIGLTEGNARDSASSITGDNVILARSILGREINVQVKYKF